MEIPLEIALIVLLAATLFHALRLERALGVLKRDRAELESLVTTFDTATQQAEQGIARLRGATEGAGMELTRQLDRAAAIREDLHFLNERANTTADRLESALGKARSEGVLSVRKEASRIPVLRANRPDDADTVGPRLHSQAERDLMQALRVGRVAAGVTAGTGEVP